MWDFGIIPFWPIRTRDVDTEGLDDLRYAIKSLDLAESNWDIMFFRMTENVFFYDLRQPGVI